MLDMSEFTALKGYLGESSPPTSLLCAQQTTRANEFVGMCGAIGHSDILYRNE